MKNSTTIRFILLVCKNDLEPMKIPNHTFVHIHLKAIPDTLITQKLGEICNEENHKLRTTQALQNISKAVFGDMRKALNILQDFFNEKSFINVENVKKYLGARVMGPVVVYNQQYERLNVIFCKKKCVRYGQSIKRNLFRFSSQL